MTRPPVAGLVCSAVFLLGLAAPPNQPNEVYRDPSFVFTRLLKDGTWNLGYYFRGVDDNWREVKCGIANSMSQGVEAGYGFQPSEKGSAVAKLLKSKIDEEGIKARVLYYGESKVTSKYDKSKKQWLYTTSWVEIPSRINVNGDWTKSSEERGRFMAWYRQEKGELVRKAESEFMSSKGFLYDREMGFLSNYSALTALSTPAMNDCIEALNRETLGRAEVLMDFFQSMPYKWIDLTDAKSGKWIDGLLLPPAVMTEGRGDCDSKAVAFCTVQRTYPERLVIFRSFRKLGDNRGGHALVGVEAWGGGNRRRHQRQKWSGALSPWLRQQLFAGILEKPMQIGLRYYTPCEVAGGSGRIPFGQVAPDRQGWYVVMPIQPLDQYIETPRPRKK